MFKKTKIYWTWDNAKQRCYNKNHKRYHDWGGRGIEMYDEWVYDFKKFEKYVMGLKNYNRPGYYSLDRINNDGNYEPGNLRWTNRQTQNFNKRKYKNNTLGYVGIRKNGNGYQASLYIDGKLKPIGTFKTKEIAAYMRDVYIINNNLYKYRYSLQIIDGTLKASLFKLKAAVNDFKNEVLYEIGL